MRWRRWGKRGEPADRDRSGPPEVPAASYAGVVSAALGSVSAGTPAVLRAETPEGLLPPEAFTPLSEVDAHPGLTNVPDVPVKFVGRRTELDKIGRYLASARTAVQIVHGLGGVGKTRLAAQLAARATAERQIAWWIDAASDTAIDEGLASFAVALQPALAGLPTDALRDRAVEWLGTHENWLVVLDDVHEPTGVRRLVDRVRGGRFLVTSRRGTGWHGTGETLLVDALDPHDASALFASVLGDASPAQRPGIGRVCTELGGLPLAIEQAAAFCAETRTDPERYLELLRRWPGQMMSAHAEGTDASRTVAQVWRLSLDRLSGVPLAADLLRILAWYAPTGIPRALLEGVWNEQTVDRALRALAAHSLIRLDAESIAVHQLVQFFTRTPDEETPHRAPDRIRTAYERAVDLLLAALPGDEATRPESVVWWRALLPHIDRVCEQRPAAWRSQETAVLQAQAGEFLYDQGSTAHAIRHLEGARADAEALFGPDEPETMLLRNNLAAAYAAAGDLERAAHLYEAVLTDRRRVLGPEHPHTLGSLNNLAAAHALAGRLSTADAIYRQAARDLEAVLGPGHPDTLAARNNLAYMSMLSGDLEAAIEQYRRLGADLARILGPDHPLTLTATLNLGLCYAQQGDHEGALPVLERSVADRERIFGPEHPQSLTALSALARVRLQAPDSGSTPELLREVLARRERVLGPDHPDTISSLVELAVILAQFGTPDPREGEPRALFAEALDRARRALGGGHPLTVFLEEQAVEVRDQERGRE